MGLCSLSVKYVSNKTERKVDRTNHRIDKVVTIMACCIEVNGQ